MVHTLHKTPKKLQHLTATTTNLNWPAPGYGGEGPCDKKERAAQPKLGCAPGPRRGGRPPTSTDGKKGAAGWRFLGLQRLPGGQRRRQRETTAL